LRHRSLAASAWVVYNSQPNSAVLLSSQYTASMLTVPSPAIFSIGTNVQQNSFFGNGNAGYFGETRLYNRSLSAADLVYGLFATPPPAPPPYPPLSPGGLSIVGSVSTLAGNGSASFADGAGTSAAFSGPAGVAVDGAGNVYVVDISNHRIRVVSEPHRRGEHACRQRQC